MNFGDIYEAVKLVASKIWVYLKPIFLMLLNEVKEEAIEVAIEVVTDLAKSDLSNSDKRDKAFDEIKDKLEARGKSLTDSAINLLIEICVSKIKLMQK